MTDTLPTELWTHIGARITVKGQLRQAWLDGAGDTRLFDKLVRHAPVGGRYEIAADDNSVIVSGPQMPMYIDQDRDNPEFVIWCALDRIARQRDAAQKQAKRDSDHDPIRDALLPLRRIMHGRLSQNDKYALVNAVSMELWRPLTKAEQEDR